MTGMRFTSLAVPAGDGPVEDIRSGPGVDTMVQRHRRRDGSSFPAEISHSEFKLRDRRLICAIVRDVTRRTEARNTLEAAMAELARSNKELQEFAYVASHDLREPLRTIGSYARLLERRYRDELDESARDFIDFIVGGVLRMQKLIEGMLNYSRVHTHGGRFEPVDLEDVLNEVREMLGLTIEDHQAQVTNSALPVVYGDRSQLIRLLENLVMNALHYHRDEPPRVHVSARPRDEHWEISVEDNGLGIEETYHERIFSLFQRLHTQAERPGTGAGLAICRRIVERHEGNIWVESEPGKGSIFHFTLPAVPETT
jgi:light-regulated signal transduction histidine kinase (bacteriophytochrome)